MRHVHRLPGPPLSKETEIALFLAHNVTVGIGIEEAWSARNTRFDVGWVRVPIICSLNSTSISAETDGLNHIVGGPGGRWPRLKASGARTSIE